MKEEKLTEKFQVIYHAKVLRHFKKLFDEKYMKDYGIVDITRLNNNEWLVRFRLHLDKAD